MNITYHAWYNFKKKNVDAPATLDDFIAIYGERPSLDHQFVNINGKYEWREKGIRKHKAYDAYIAMKRRCDDKIFKKYEYYGKRGITYCDRWKSFYLFMDDMGDSWSEGLTIDRIDPDGNYEPSNCRWVDRSTQTANRRIGVNNTSGFIGVNKHPNVNGWICYVSFRKKRKYLGSFSSAVDAAKERDRYILENDLPNKLNF